jgi:pyridoxamine 5'-phosphate oxidase
VTASDLSDTRKPSDLSTMRGDYRASPELTEADLRDGWQPLLRAWIDAAVAAAVAEPNAMVVATVDADGLPAARTVLCKQLRPDGVVFYSNYDSDKARELAATPFAAVTFTWPELARQVRLRGPVRRVDAEDTAAYWRSRPRGSQLGAWASRQSREVSSRAALDAAQAEIEARFAGVEQLPVPPFWGGYLVTAREVEFWQGRQGRLHDRLRTARAADGSWPVVRLQP